MKSGPFLRFFSKLFIILLFTTLFSLLFRHYLLPFVSNDIENISTVSGTIATIYTLIVAFIIVEVWSEFNTISEKISSEARSLVSIWDYIDFLDDESTDNQMRKTLIGYIDNVMDEEREDASLGNRTKHPSPKLVSIMNVLDELKLDSSKDEAIFPLLVEEYKDLSASRSSRLDLSVNRIPPFLMLWFVFLSFLILITFMFIEFNSDLVGSISMILLSSVIATAYILIADLDNPFDGLWNVDYSPFEEANNYIKESEHTKG